MILYVESNFVLEIALGQEQGESAEHLLRQCESGVSELRIPSFALAEPFATITQRGRSRRQLTNSLEEQIGQLARSQPHQEEVLHLQSAPAVLRSIEARETYRLQDTIERILSVGTCLPIELSTFYRATSYQSGFGLSPQDALIYASVIEDLERHSGSERRLFVNRNSRDFRDPGISAELQLYQCRLETNFDLALASLRST